MKGFIFVGLISFAIAQYWSPSMDEDYFEKNPDDFMHEYPYSVSKSSDEGESDAGDSELPKDPMINDGFFEGDIDGFEQRNGVPDDILRWPNAIVPYEIHSSLNHIKPLVQSAMKHIESKTCIRFVERTDESDYIGIQDGRGCSSQWGRRGGRQRLSLFDPGCHVLSIIVHELMHAIGFLHEHSRSDRDDYVDVFLRNVLPGQGHNFIKMLPNENRLFTQFDDNSIMLYGSRSFARLNTYTMLRKDGSVIQEVSQKTSMTDLDAEKINKLYECTKR